MTNINMEEGNMSRAPVAGLIVSPLLARHSGQGHLGGEASYLRFPFHAVLRSYRILEGTGQ